MILDLKRVIYELLWHVIRGDLKQDDALVVLGQTKVSDVINYVVNLAYFNIKLITKRRNVVNITAVMTDY